MTLLASEACQRPADFVLLGTCFGLATGAAELASRVFAWSVLGVPFHYDLRLDLLWMVPLADAVLFGTLGLLIALARIRWRGDRFTRVVLAGLGAMAAYTVLLHYLSLNHPARILLSLGAGVQMGRVLARHLDGVRRFVRIVTLPGICVVLTTGFAFRATEIVREHRALAQLAPAATRAPNVLIIVLDTFRAADLSLYGYPRPTTPNLERLAAKSVVFETAISTASWTLPSHASIFTGRFPYELSADWDVPLDATHPTLAELFRDRGYLTAGFVANQFYGTPEFGLSRGFVHYESQERGPGQVLVSSRLGNALVRLFNWLTHGYYVAGKMTASECTGRLVGWFSYPRSRPFFVFVNYFDAHAPYVAPPPYDHLFSRVEPPTRAIRVGHRNTEAELRGMRDAYDGSIAYIDAQLGVLMRGMENRRLLSNTLIIITSDHGEEFGEHGWVSHGNGLHLPALHVPLLISFPGRIPGGVRIAEAVTLRDLPATVVELLGLGGKIEFPGRSLAGLWGSGGDSLQAPPSPLLSEVNRPRQAPAWYAVARGDMKSIIVGRHHYIRNGDGGEELYDIVGDPWETIDLARSEAGKAMLNGLRTRLASALGNGAR